MARAVRRAWTFLWDPAEPSLRLRIGASFGLMIGAKLTTIQVPFLFKYAIDALSEQTVSADGVATMLEVAASQPLASTTTAVGLLALSPASLLLMYGATRVCADGMTQLRSALFARVAEGALRRMARRTFAHLHALELKFHLERQTGALTRVVERGTRAVGTLLSTSVLQVLPLAFEVSAVSGLLAYKCGPAFAGATLGTLCMYAGFTFYVTRARTAVRRAQNAADAEASQRFTDSMLNFETVKYFDATALEEKRYDEALAKYESAAITTQLTLAGLNFGQAAIFSSGLGVTMMLAANEVAAGNMSVGDVVMVQGLVFQLLLPLNILGTVYNQVRQASIDMAALNKLQQRQPTVASLDGAPELVLKGGRIEFENVHFGYGEPAGADAGASADARADAKETADGSAVARHLLNGVSFVVEPGQTVAIVGRSGSGKSSLLRLLYRFYDPHVGRITIDGQDLREVDLDSVRRVLGMVPQDVVLFNETVRYNLRYGRPEATDAEVEQAARQASVHDAILRMPDGYDTRVGERGLKLSGGEKQRIAIGRALLRDPPILLCDEATSAVDTVTEAQIFSSLHSGRAAAASSARHRRPLSAPSQQQQQHQEQPRTCLVIAHRLSTVVDADRILVMGAGEVIEAGTHAELVALGGEYAALWAMQQAQGYESVGSGFADEVEDAETASDVLKKR